MVSLSAAELDHENAPRNPATEEKEEEKSDISDGSNHLASYGNFQPGDYLDVQDSVGKWCEAQIVSIDFENRKVLVTYLYWPDSFNEWIEFDSPKLAPKGSMTYAQGGELRVGHRIEAKDTANQWIEAEVIAANEDTVRIHYKNWHPKFDENLPKTSDRIRPYGHFKVLNKKSKPLSKNRVTPLHQQDRIRKTTNIQFSQYEQALNTQGLGVREIEGDGNCLFRSVSHQIYGDDRYHMLVRQKCIEYMECEREYFKPFIEGNMSDFMAYLSHKAQSGVWGDDPEIQAMCELYNRPAEIWCFDPHVGARKMRTLHEVSSHGLRAPMRLSYYGGGHYDSVVRLDGFEPLVRSTPGTEENMRIEMAQLRSDRGGVEEAKEQSDVLATEQEALTAALQASRDDFERLEDDLDVLFAHQTELVLAEAESDQITQDMLVGTEQEEVNEALALSSQALDSQELERAMALSTQAGDDSYELGRALALSAQTAPPPADELERAIAMSQQESGDPEELERALALSVDPELQHALQMSEQDPDVSMEAAIAMSLREGQAAMGASLDDEDDELQRAIELSHQHYS